MLGPHATRVDSPIMSQGTRHGLHISESYYYLLISVMLNRTKNSNIKIFSSLVRPELVSFGNKH